MNNRDYYRLIPSVKKEEIKQQYEHRLKCGISKTEVIMRICQTYDLMFDQTIVADCRDIGDYMRKIHSFKQYDGKKFVDSIILLGEEKKKVNTDEIIDKKEKLSLLQALKEEQELLLDKIRVARQEDNIGTYKNLILALKEVTYLVQNEERKQIGENTHTLVGFEDGRPN